MAVVRERLAWHGQALPGLEHKFFKQCRIWREACFHQGHIPELSTPFTRVHRALLLNVHDQHNRAIKFFITIPTSVFRGE